MTQLLTDRRLLALVAAAVLLCGSVRVAPVFAADEDPTAQIETLFRQAIDLYEQGKYAESQIKLKEMEDKDPRSPLVARLVDEAGTRIMARMMADVRMGSEPTRLWEQYRRYNLGKRADKDRMTKLAARLIDPAIGEEERNLIYIELGQLGQYAVPFLAPHLKDPTNLQARAHARIAIARMGRAAVLPLIALLDHSEPLMRENAILALGDISPADTRALAPLKARIDDPKENGVAKNYAQRVFQKISGMSGADGKPAVAYYYDSANRYYLDKANVAEEAEEAAGLIWHLNAAGELVSVQYPLWAWNEQMAEAQILSGLALDPNAKQLYALWACNAASQYSEVKDLLDIANEQPPRHNFSEEEKKELADWDKKEVDARRMIAAVGKEYVNDALNKVHEDLAKYPGHTRLPGIGMTLAHELEALDPKGDLLAGGCALCTGLDSREVGIQYACAVALANINRFPADWAGSEKVGALLGRGVSENKPIQILLVEEDANAANAMSAQLKSLGYGVTVADSGRNAVTAARSFPPKDVAVIAENLQRDLKANQVIEELRAEVSTRYLPAGILGARADHDLLQSRFGSGTILVERESTGPDLKDPIEKLGAQRVPTSANKRRANEVAILCANTLAKVDVNATKINLNDAVKNAIDALVNRPDEVRNPAAIFLGRVGGGADKDAAAEGLKRVFEDATAAVELRRNALRALGRTKIDGLDELYMKAQSEADQEIKDIAAEAFGQKSRDGKAIFDLISANRIDKAVKEK